MPRYGFIYEKLDIKILILFILRRLPGVTAPIDLQDFTQQCDEGFGYFEYSDCLAELIESGLIIEEDDGLRISKRGAEAVETVESSLPFSVRKKAERIIAPEAERRRRLEMITAQHKLRDGGCFVTLALNDGKGEIMRLNILSSGEEQAERIENNFRENAEGIYVKLIGMLDGSDENKKQTEDKNGD